jgi:UPF0271 protein
MKAYIDLNCDLGEDPRRVDDGTDAQIASCVSSLNVACGGHAGDARTMRTLARLAATLGRALGAHPSYPDRAGFGRVRMAINTQALEASLVEQLSALAIAAEREGAAITHVKPHGALYHAAASEEPVAATIGRAAQRVLGPTRLVGPAGSTALAWWRQMGHRPVGEAFADRGYSASGSLIPRGQPGALLEASSGDRSPASQAVRLATRGEAITPEGAIISVRAESICLHGDAPGALANARAIALALHGAGVQIAPPA